MIERDHRRSNNDLLSKASSCYSSTAALSRDVIDHEPWDRSRVVGYQSKFFPHESDASAASDEHANKQRKKDDHHLVKYIKYQVIRVFSRYLLYSDPKSLLFRTLSP